MLKNALTLSLFALSTLAPLANADTLVKMTTNRGDIVLNLDEQKAPITVANFLNYVDKQHYEGLIFHRVIAGFMIQGGGMDAELRPKPTDKPIQNEARNGLKNSTGTIAMARTRDPHSATSQFFINTADNNFLNYATGNPGYAVFGAVVEGMDVVRAIEASATTSKGMHKDVPREPVIIESITRLAP